MNRSGPILAIDSSTDQAGIAVLGSDVRIALSWDAGRNQTTTILDQIDRCLSLAGLRPAALSGIAVASGPGMFTSLRVGVSLAKGLAFGVDLPVVGISSLRVAADPWLDLDRDVLAVVAVGRGRVVWQRFAKDGNVLTEPVNGSVEELDAAVSEAENALIVGDIAGEATQSLRGRGMQVRSGVTVRRDPLVLARLGLERLDMSGPDDLVLLQPAYVHSRSGKPVGV